MVFALQAERAHCRRFELRNRSAPPTCRREDLVARGLHKVPGRPFGLPAVPLPNCGCFPGLPIFLRAALYRFSLFDHLLETLGFQTLKIKFKFRMHCLEAVHLIEPADNDIGVMAIDFNAVARLPAAAAANGRWLACWRRLSNLSS